MPHIGIIRGFGEGYYATGYIIKIIKELNKRFRSKITFEEIPVGNYLEYSTELSRGSIERMRQLDVIFAGSFKSPANPLDYSLDDLVMALSNNVEYLSVCGLGKYDGINLLCASYFDGGSSLRESIKSVDGSAETRICSAYTAFGVAKHVSRQCENRRRRLAVVSDDSNEYCADLFFKKFEEYTLPLSNFHMIKFSADEIVYEILNNPSQFDVIFVSRTMLDIIGAIYHSIMGDGFVAYKKYGMKTPVYAPQSCCINAGIPTEIPSFYGYVAAFSKMLGEEFGLLKEEYALNRALTKVWEANISPYDGESFVKGIIESIEEPLNIKFSKKPTKVVYIK